MRIDQRILADIRAHVHKHRRHADDAARDVRAYANAGAAGNNAHAVRGGNRLHRIGGLIEEGLAARVNGHVHDRAHAKAEENALFHPGIDAPTGGRSRVGLRSADFTAIQARLEGPEQREVLRQISGGRNIKERFNLWLQHEFARGDSGIRERREYARDFPALEQPEASATPAPANAFRRARPSRGWDWTRRN